MFAVFRVQLDYLGEVGRLWKIIVRRVMEGKCEKKYKVEARQNFWSGVLAAGCLCPSVT